MAILEVTSDIKNQFVFHLDLMQVSQETLDICHAVNEGIPIEMTITKHFPIDFNSDLMFEIFSKFFQLELLRIKFKEDNELSLVVRSYVNKKGIRQ